jgi:GT2 family glycosyltransferase/glycosyltransferase involved in cell wall biosynthesis
VTVPAAPLVWHLPPRRSYDVIVLANVCWRTRQQRPHHVARTFARHGHRVFYVSMGVGQLGQEDLVDDGVIEVEFTPSRAYDRYSQIPDNALVAEWMAAMQQLRERHGVDDAVVHVHLQSWTPLAWELRGAFSWRIVYDCMDEWENFPGMGHELLRAERELVEGADLVVTTAESLRRKWLPLNPNTRLVRNGVDADFFARNCLPSDVLADVARPIVGFTGALADWVDFELVAAVARARPEWTVVLVGDVFVPPDRLCGLDRMDNVVMTGLQPYLSMPLYLFCFDVAMIPFVVDAISAAVDPVKFYEYAASGTPIVTTRLPELDEYRPLFYEGSDARTFELAIERALDEDPDRHGARVALAAANTWDDRYAQLDQATRSLWPTVSVIIVTYGQLAHTRRCIESVIANTSHPALEVIVVDNGSTDGTPAYLRHVAARDDRVTVILNADNRGFAAANNQGLEVATGEVLILLNNDTEVSPGWHVPLLEHLNDSTIGLIGPRSDNVGNIARIDVPSEFADDLAGFTRLVRRRHDGEVFEIGMLGMFCVAMRSEVYKAIGPLDEGYGVGLFEDDDFAERVRAAGWRVACARDAFVHHVGQATFTSLIDAGEYDALWARNRARFESRWGRWRAQEGGLEPEVID